MRSTIQYLNNNFTYSKALQWGKLISITAVAQISIQGLGMLNGILIIRLLSTKEYALYTIANTMLGTMTMLADSGISNGAMAEGGKVWQDKKKLGAVQRTSLNLRKRFGTISLIVTLPILSYLLFEHGASFYTIALILIAMIPSFISALSDSLLEMVPALHQAIKPLQKNQVEVSLGKLILSISLLTIFPFTYIALVANSIPRIYGNYKLRKIASHFASDIENSDPIVEKAINRSIKRTLPVVIYHSISGQLSIWLVSFFGTTSNISQLGALSRLSMIFNLFASLFSILMIPRFSRIETNNKFLLRYFVLIQIFSFIISIIPVLFIWLFSSQILWVLGSQYAGLNYELVLVGFAGSVGLMENVCSRLVINRGWIPNPYILIMINFLSTVVALNFFDLSVFDNILYFNIGITFISYLLGLGYGLLNISRIKEQ